LNILSIGIVHVLVFDIG